MSRWSQYDTDEERLPDGMERVGYDADTEVYTFRDADGSYWESAPGCRFGNLTRVGDADHEAQDTEPFLMAEEPQRQVSWRTEMMPLLNFGLLVGLSLLALFWFLHWNEQKEEPLMPLCDEGDSIHKIEKGDTCWDIAESNGIHVDDILRNNIGLNCDDLTIGSLICLPPAPV